MRLVILADHRLDDQAYLLREALKDIPQDRRAPDLYGSMKVCPGPCRAALRTPASTAFSVATVWPKPLPRGAPADGK
jgi:hypothetical protein